jgi:hypothetical protein
MIYDSSLQSYVALSTNTATPENNRGLSPITLWNKKLILRESHAGTKHIDLNL